MWQAADTTQVERKQILRCLIARVVVPVRCDSEFAAVTIHWAGGYTSHHNLLRPVATYAQLRNFERRLARGVALRAAGHTAAHIATRLNAEGFYPPKRRGAFTPPVLDQVLKRRALMGNEGSHDELLASNQWWLTDLARARHMSHLKLRDWVGRGWGHGRKTPVQGYWLLGAAKPQVHRLHALVHHSRRGMQAYASHLTTPQQRPPSTDDFPSVE